jgi:cell division protein FtsI/penicillin-binding protein 2
MVGRTGLEWVYENELRGKPGGTLYVNGPEGQLVGSMVTVDPELPQAVTTTLDRDLQRQAQDAIADFRGAIVVVERDSGRVLAMVSSPGFDPNLFDTQSEPAVRAVRSTKTCASADQPRTQSTFDRSSRSSRWRRLGRASTRRNDLRLHGGIHRAAGAGLRTGPSKPNYRRPVS